MGPTLDKLIQRWLKQRPYLNKKWHVLEAEERDLYKKSAVPQIIYSGREASPLYPTNLLVGTTKVTNVTWGIDLDAHNPNFFPRLERTLSTLQGQSNRVKKVLEGWVKEEKYRLQEAMRQVPKRTRKGRK